MKHIALNELELHIEAELRARLEYIVHRAANSSVSRFELLDSTLDPADSIGERLEGSCLFVFQD